MFDGPRLAPWWLEWERAEPEAAGGTLRSRKGKFQPRGAALPPLAADTRARAESPVRPQREGQPLCGGGREDGAGTGTGSLCVSVRAGAGKVLGFKFLAAKFGFAIFFFLLASVFFAPTPKVWFRERQEPGAARDHSRRP